MMSKESATYVKTLADAAKILQVPYTQLYKHKHRPEFTKGARGYNVKKIGDYLTEMETLREEEEKAQSLIGAEEELIEKQIKLETARHKCRLLELQIKQKEGNLVDVNQVIESRAKELTRLRSTLTEMVMRLPMEVQGMDEDGIRCRLSESVNAILADLSEFIQDDWEDVTDEPITEGEEEA